MTRYMVGNESHERLQQQLATVNRELAQAQKDQTRAQRVADFWEARASQAAMALRVAAATAAVGWILAAAMLWMEVQR